MITTDGGQLYTIEGFAAALIMIITAFLVMNATSIYTAGDTHINDMQLEALGSDALKMMATPVNSSENDMNHNTLRTIIEEPNSTIKSEMFRTNFLTLVNATGTGPKHDIQYNASYTCRIKDPIDPNKDIVTIPFSYSRNLTGGEHTVRATKWVVVKAGATNITTNCGGTAEPNRAVLVELLLWRD
jgi:hypothetical protein